MMSLMAQEKERLLEHGRKSNGQVCEQCGYLGLPARLESAKQSGVGSKGRLHQVEAHEQICPMTANR